VEEGSSVISGSVVVGSMTGPGPKIGLIVISGPKGVGSMTGPGPRIGLKVK
jgi:hypothetical protein